MSTQIGSKLKTKLQKPSTVNSCSRCYYHLWHLCHLPFPPSFPGKVSTCPRHPHLARSPQQFGPSRGPQRWRLPSCVEENCFFTRNSKLFRFPQKHSTCTGFFLRQFSVFKLSLSSNFAKSPFSKCRNHVFPLKPNPSHRNNVTSTPMGDFSCCQGIPRDSPVGFRKSCRFTISPALLKISWR